jgi:hypothetical protein|tara:strand:- start:845 stop:1228 length:384 start_codon:yes stop_codon:yes gene_type:complete
MGQRVNIQYSVELEDLQDEVNRLFEQAMRELERGLVVGGTPVVNLGTEGLDKIDSFRQKLAKVDIMIGDVQNIIEGYIRFKTQPPPERESPFQQTSDELEVEQLEEQIAKFKETLSAQPNQEPEESN